MRNLHRIQKNKLLLALWAGCCLSTSLTAQSLPSTLISSGSARASSASLGTLEWSIGEPVSGTFSPSASTTVLTQGFHQTFVTVTAVSESADAVKVSVYPNPTSEVIHVVAAESVRLRLWGIGGELLKEEANGATDHQVMVAGLPAGLYLLEVQLENNKPPLFFKISVVK